MEPSEGLIGTDLSVLTPFGFLGLRRRQCAVSSAVLHLVVSVSFSLDFWSCLGSESD